MSSTQPNLPIEILSEVTSILAAELAPRCQGNGEASDGGKALRNLAEVSTTFRDIAQRHLFRTLEVRLAGARYSDRQAQRDVERLSIYQKNPRLLDYVRSFFLDYLWDPFDEFDAPNGPPSLEMCQKTLAFFLPRFRYLDYFSTTSNHWAGRCWDMWDEATRQAVSLCVSRNPLRTFELAGWKGPVDFLPHLPPSITTLIVSRSGTELKNGATTSTSNTPRPPSDSTHLLQFRPQTVRLDIDFFSIPPFIVSHGGAFLSRLRTLEVGQHNLKILNAILCFVPQTLECLHLHYFMDSSYLPRAPSTSLAQSLTQCSSDKRFVPISGLHTLKLSIVDTNMFCAPYALKPDALGQVIAAHLTPAFASTRCLVLDLSFYTRIELEKANGGTDPRLSQNLFDGYTKEFSAIDQSLAGNEPVFPQLETIVVDLHIGERTIPHDPIRGDDFSAAEDWVLKKVAEDMISTLRNTASRLKCNVSVFSQF